MPTRPRQLAARPAVAAVLALAGVALGQPAAEKGGAIRLPDGAIVVFADGPEKLGNINGVFLSAKEYAALVERAEAAKRGKDAAKPVPPASCQMKVRIDSRGDKSVAVVSMAFAYRTTVPKQVVALGGGKAFPVAANGNGPLPVLEATADGWAVVAETVGDHALTLEVETAVTPRGPNGEPGFEVTLPRAAITTLAIDPPAGVGKLTASARPADQPRPTKTTDAPARFAGRGLPLGPAEWLEVTWEPPAAAPVAPAAAAVTADITVRVDESTVETLARLTMTGGGKAWSFTFPPDADATFDSGVVFTPPTDAAKPVWAAVAPDRDGPWGVSVRVRKPRGDPKAAADVGVGPFHAAGVPRQAGTIRVFAPASVRLGNFRHPPEVRRQDAPPGDDAPAAAFRYAAAGDSPVPLLRFDARPARGAVSVQPSHRLTLTPGGWKLRTELRVVPVRRAVEQVLFTLPPGWADPEVRPLELVEEVQGGKGPAVERELTIRLAAAKREPFTLVLEARFPVAPPPRDGPTPAALPLPRFARAGADPQAEREASVAVVVPDGFEVRGSAREWDGAQPSQSATDLRPPVNGGSGLAAAFEGGVARVDLTWQPVRPEVSAEVRADVTVDDKQASVTQTIKLSAADPLARPVRLRGPASPLRWRPRPATVEPDGPGEWTYAPPPNRTEVTLTFSYAVRLPTRADGGPVRASIPLVWPDVPRTDAVCRVWTGDGGRRVAGVEGAWRELPPEPAADRDSLPALTLGGTAPAAGLPLTLDLADPPDPTAGAVIDRASVQVWTADDGTVQTRARFLLRRWPAAGVDVECASAGPPLVSADRLRVRTLLPAGDDGDVRTYRVPLPDPDPAKPTLVLEVRTTQPARPTGPLILHPPKVRGAAYRGPVWWHVGLAGNPVPLLFGGPPADVRWRWREFGFAPAPAVTSAELDRWFADGAEPDADWPTESADAVAFRQPALSPVRVDRLPRAGWVLGCSVLAAVAGFGLSRLRPGPLGLAVALGGVLLATLAALAPQPAGQLAAGGQWGAAAAAAGLLAQAGVRKLRAMVAERRSGFVRVGPTPSVRTDPSARGTATGPAAVPASSVR